MIMSLLGFSCNFPRGAYNTKKRVSAIQYFSYVGFCRMSNGLDLWCWLKNSSDRTMKYSHVCGQECQEQVQLMHLFAIYNTFFTFHYQLFITIIWVLHNSWCSRNAETALPTDHNDYHLYFGFSFITEIMCQGCVCFCSPAGYSGYCLNLLPAK